MKCVPKLNWPYWSVLIIASIFGANAGDFLAGVLGLGHLRGLPILAICLIVTFFAERTIASTSALFYWIAIIIIRAAATNVGDIFHDLRISFAYSVPGVFLLLLGFLAYRARSKPLTDGQTAITADGFYWTTMFVAGVLGTVAGDAMSFGVHLGTLNATVALGVPVAVLLTFGRRGLLNHLFYYWMTIALIRSAGTAAGDFLAHAVFGLQISTGVTGLIFLGAVITAYGASRNSTRLAAGNAGRELTAPSKS